MSPASVFQDRTSLPKAWGTRIVWQGTGMLVHVSAEEDYGIDLFKAEEEEYGQIFTIIERQFGPMARDLLRRRYRKPSLALRKN